VTDAGIHVFMISLLEIDLGTWDTTADEMLTKKMVLKIHS
jgi:hypothetical protein